MTIKNYLKENHLKIIKIASDCNLPYSTVNALINGKVDIDNFRVGAARSIAKACDLSFDEFYNMCKEMTTWTQHENCSILVKNQRYYLKYEIGKYKGMVDLAKVNKLNREFLNEIVELELREIQRKIQLEEND